MQLTHKLESARFQTSKLKCDILVSIQAFAVKCNLHRYTTARQMEEARANGGAGCIQVEFT
jgi:hypothetical protein